jgi:hypothetical protein
MINTSFRNELLKKKIGKFSPSQIGLIMNDVIEQPINEDITNGMPTTFNEVPIFKSDRTQ